jgi:HlyD family secretion protein
MDPKIERPPASASPPTSAVAEAAKGAAEKTASTAETPSTIETHSATEPASANPRTATAKPDSPAQAPPPQKTAPTTQPAKATQQDSAKKPAPPSQPAPSEPPASSSKKKTLIAGVVVAALAVLAIGFLVGRIWGGSKKDPNQLVLFGNVDLRQVELAFNGSERIAEVLVEEGDRVRRGQILARLDTSRLKPEAAEAQAELEAQQAVVERLHNGSRPEETAQARANVALAKADQVNAEQQWNRVTALAGLSTGRAISQQDIDSAKEAVDTARARLVVAQKGLDLSMIGPRPEDIAQGEAMLRGDQAKLDLLRRQLADAELVSPCDAVVRSRLLEPGEMISPQRPVFDLAIENPKWIRTYVPDPDLGRIHTGMKASISSDSFPDRTLSGWVGFISSVAEFTPKAVQTEELRPGLVYEIRVFVQDPGDEMRLGMPATVHLELSPADKNQQ